MKKNIAVISIVSALIFLALSCMPAETVVIKGDLTGLEFTVPGVPYTLADHEYARGEYRVTAHYSTGYQEDVTASAKIEGDEYVELTPTGGLTFKSCYTNGHKYTLTVSYGGITKIATVYAYNRVGDYLSFTVKSDPTKFFEGASLLTPGIVEKISYITESGMSSSTSLPKSGFVTIYDKDDNVLESGTLETIRPLKEGDARITYSVYKDSEARSINIEVLPLTDAKGIYPLRPSDLEAGKEFDTSTFMPTYMKNYRVYLCDNEDVKKADVRSLMYVTDEDGDVKDGYTITVTVSRDGSEVTIGTFKKGDTITIKDSSEVTTKDTFEKGDTITIKVDYNNSEGTTLTGTRDDITVY